ncbi:hypothetical protein AGMMS49991_06430 [Spirochaetia bacterium]|nr:hypothetical protein AGMMS49991_06430 [Spirochaetia bacterium]
MCPDRQILSVYFDGELPSPWKEQLESHLHSCPQCRADFEQIRRISAFITGNETAGSAALTSVTAAAQERVWQNLANRGKAPESGRPDRSPGRRERLWSRSVRIPLPAAVAAAALLIITFTLAVFNFTGRSGQEQDSAMAAGMNLDLQGILPVSDMNGVLQYLGNEDTGDIMIIRLPESKSFMSAGQPTIIKAADYSRSNTPR